MSGMTYGVVTPEERNSNEGIEFLKAMVAGTVPQAPMCETLGRKRTTSSMLVMPWRFRSDPVNAWMLADTSCRLSSRFCAVTMISSRPPAVVPDCWAWADAW